MNNISIPIIIIELKITVPGFIEDLLNNRLNKRSKVNARITTEPTDPRLDVFIAIEFFAV